MLRIPSDRSAAAIIAVRWGLGGIWGFNLLYVVLPANQFFPTFSATVSSFDSESLGGAALPSLANAYPSFAAVGVAVLTGYLAIAFLLGVTTRAACIVGAAFSGLLLALQFGLVWNLPGPTDVGPHPLYLLAYLALLIGYGEAPGTVDHLIRKWTHVPGASTLLAIDRRVLSEGSPQLTRPARD